MSRLPLPPTLFPYTTLFRSLLARDAYGIKPLFYADNGRCLRAASQVKALLQARDIDTSAQPAGHAGFRSEEHTSELQSLRHLVCRLLLEKKKQRIRQSHCTR